MHRSVLSVFLAVRLWLGALALIAGTAAAVAAEGPQAANLSVVDLDAEALKERMIAPKAIGDLVAPTGRIIAADPLVNPDHPPFGRTVAPGSYPVTLFFAQERVALAMLRLAPGKIARWRIATTPGQDARKLKDGEIFGYGVDAGLGSFMDHEAVRAMRWRGRETKCDNYYDCVLADELAANNDDYAMHLPMKDEDANVAVFSSGWGDGFYATYWGEDESGQALALVTDFGVLEDGDGRTLQQRRVAAMSPEQREAAGRAHAAIQRDDEAALRAVLIEGVATPEAFAPETGETLTLEAVRGDKPKALETLIRYGARREVDAETARVFELRTYADYAGSLEKPIEGLNEQPPKLSAALKDVLARWDAGAIAPASDGPASAPPGGAKPTP
ncbi:DUF4241 domain-containing protein [Chenggangzhangella methanolivorans]|uniref:DUF4241 domain-containing protein n=1 Tax=Chenggangzhangella methanolivorans TaxID=1437009 RepID=UPI0036168A81